MGKFEVGEIAIYMPWDPKTSNATRFAGAEVEITDPLAVYPLNLADPDYPRYGVRFPDGSKGWVFEESLRKRRPPESYKDQFTPASKDFNWREPVKGEVVA